MFTGGVCRVLNSENTKMSRIPGHRLILFKTKEKYVQAYFSVLGYLTCHAAVRMVLKQSLYWIIDQICFYTKSYKYHIINVFMRIFL